MAANRDAGKGREVQLPEPNQPEVGRVENDVDTRAMGKFAIALAVICVGALVLLAGLFRYFEAHEAAGEPAAANVKRDARRLPPEPRLQTQETVDLKQIRAAEDQTLESYGWVDQQRGVVRLPIRRAIDLLVQRGLPTRGSSEAPAASGVTTPTDSGLGYKMAAPGGPLASETR